MLNALKTLKLWQVIVLIAVTFGMAGGVYGIYSWATGLSTASLPANTQLIPVQYGNLVSSVSASGSLVFPTRTRLTFGSAGTVEELNVKAGETVEKGRVLAKLDSASVVSLQKAVAQARISLRNAEQNLEEAQNPYTVSDIAQAETAAERARQALNNASEELSLAQKDWAKRIAEAEDSLSQAIDRYKSNVSFYYGIELTDEQVYEYPDWILSQEPDWAKIPPLPPTFPTPNSAVETDWENLKKLLT